MNARTGWLSLVALSCLFLAPIVMAANANNDTTTGKSGPDGVTSEDPGPQSSTEADAQTAQSSPEDGDGTDEMDAMGDATSPSGMGGMTGMGAMQGPAGKAGDSSMSGMQGQTGPSQMQGMQGAPGMEGMTGQEAPMQDPIKEKSMTQEFTDQIMAWFGEANTRSALRALNAHLPVTPSEHRLLSNRIRQARHILDQRFGSPLEHRRIRAERIKDFMVRYTYVELREGNLTRWSFTLYRPLERWLLLSVMWDDDSKDLLN